MNGDLISRSALKKAITDATYNFEQIPIRVDKVKEIIDKAPTVEYTFEEAFQKTVCENKLYCPSRPQGKFECRMEIKDLISMLLEYDMNEKATIYTPDEDNIVISITDTREEDANNE